jgi:Crinkler effector protein N-terminal domain
MLVHVHTPMAIFPAEIASTKTVGALKKEIQEEKRNAFKDVDMGTLVIWQVSFPTDNGLQKNLQSLDFVENPAINQTNIAILKWLAHQEQTCWRGSTISCR